MDDSPEEAPQALSPRARALFAGAVVVFLVLPAVAMLIMLTSGGGLSSLLDSILSDVGKQLSGVGDRL